MDPLKTAIDAMDDKALAGGATDTGHGWRHAALICRLNWTVPRALRQLQQHAKYHQEGQPEKAAAYREAAALLQTLTGEKAAPAPAALPPMPVQTSLFATA
jgi:hypothetical protein